MIFVEGGTITWVDPEAPGSFARSLDSVARNNVIYYA
jgi:hypothetical protein